MRHITKLLLIACFVLTGSFLFAQEINESFNDGDFTSGPVWSGDVADWEVVASTASTGAAGSNTLHQNVLVSGPGSTYLSTPCSNWQTQQNWSFFVGRRNRVFQNSNYVEIWLYSDIPNLEGAANGYLIRIGNTTNKIELQRVTGGTGTTILSSPAFPNNVIKDVGIDIEVTRDVAGNWILKSSPIPTVNGTGPTANLDPLTQTTVTHGIVNDGVYVPGGTGYCGYLAKYSGSTATRQAAELDQFVLTTSGSTTELNYLLPTASTLGENAGTLSIPVGIMNHSATLATTADIVLVSGSAARINGYTTQTVTFPAGSTAAQFATITITNNADCDGEENLVFEIQNVVGGTAAAVGTQDTYTLTILDNDQGSKNIVSENFETGSLYKWRQHSPGDWVAGNGNPVNGIYALNHVVSGTSGTSGTSRYFGNTTLKGVTTQWNFNFNALSNEPTDTENFMVFLSANEEDLTSSTVDGYAVGVRAASSGDPDWITLWKITDGAATAVITSAIDYGPAYDIIGIEVTRDESGNWELLIDEDGDFDNLISEGTATNADYVDMSYAGAYYSFSAATSGDFIVDDLTIHQMGCPTTYYSQGSGHASDPIWDTNPVGTGGMAIDSKFNNFVVQNGHTVTLLADMDIFELTVESGATLSPGSKCLNIYDNFYIDGTFVAGTGHIWMQSDGYVEMGNAAGTVKFYDVTIYSNGGDIIQLGDFEIENVFTPSKGYFDTDGNAFTLLSTSTKTASIGQMTWDADFYGDVILERYIPFGPQNWVLVGNSLTGATLNEWNDDIVTTGFTGSDWPAYPFDNIANYDETTGATFNDGFYYPTNITDPLSSTAGYGIYMVEGLVTMDVTGEFQRMDISHNLDYTNTGTPADDGFNLVVNRYPSEIDYDAMYNISFAAPTYYLWDGDTQTYLTYNAITGIGAAPAQIASSQSFWVQASGPGETLEYEESIKSTTGVAFERDYESVQQLEISLTKGDIVDRTYIGFKENASTAYDNLYDARKITISPSSEPLSVKLSSTMDDTEFAVNILPLLEDAVTIPLNITNTEGGEMILSIDNVEGFEEGYCLMIENTETGTITAVEEGTSFTFFTEAGYEGQRYIIHTGMPIDVETQALTCYNSNDGIVTAYGYGEGPFDYTWYDESGDVIFSETNIYGSSEITGLTFGNYTVEIYDENSSCSTTAVTVYIGQGSEEAVSMEIYEDGCETFEEGSIEINPEFEGSYTYEIYDVFGNLIQSDVAEGSVIEELPGGIYDVIVTTQCSVIEMEANLIDEDAITITYDSSDLEITLENGEYLLEFDAEVENATTVNWFIDGQLVALDESFEYTFTEDGTYLVTLNAESTNCSASVDQVVIVTSTNSINDLLDNDISLIQKEEGLVITFDANYPNARLELINTIGQIVESINLQTGDGTTASHKINHLSDGAYIVRIQSENQLIFTQQIIK